MLITPEDILGMNNSLDDLYKKERVNINCFGSLTIKCSDLFILRLLTLER